MVGADGHGGLGGQGDGRHVAARTLDRRASRADFDL